MVAAVPFIGSVFFDGVVPFLMHLYQSDTVLGIRLKKLIIIFRGGDTHKSRIITEIICHLPGKIIVNAPVPGTLFCVFGYAAKIFYPCAVLFKCQLFHGIAPGIIKLFARAIRSMPASVSEALMQIAAHVYKYDTMPDRRSK